MTWNWYIATILTPVVSDFWTLLYISKWIMYDNKNIDNVSIVTDLYINRHHNDTERGMRPTVLFPLCLAPPTSSHPSLDVLVSSARETETITPSQQLHPLPDYWELRAHWSLLQSLLSAEEASPWMHKSVSIKHPRASHYYIISSLTWIIYPSTPCCTHSPVSVVWFLLLLLLLSWLTAG